MPPKTDRQTADHAFKLLGQALKYNRLPADDGGTKQFTADHFMFMQTVEQGGAQIHMFKNRQTRNYLYVEEKGGKTKLIVPKSGQAFHKGVYGAVVATLDAVADVLDFRESPLATEADAVAHAIRHIAVAEGIDRPAFDKAVKKLNDALGAVDPAIRGILDWIKNNAEALGKDNAKIAREQALKLMYAINDDSKKHWYDNPKMKKVSSSPAFYAKEGR